MFQMSSFPLYNVQLFGSYRHSFLALFSGNDMKKLAKEVTLMLSFEHTNVLSLIGVVIDAEMPLLIMPLMPNGNLLEFLRHHKQELLLTSGLEPQVTIFVL